MTDTHDKAQLIRQHLTAITSAWPNMLPDAPHATHMGTIGRHDPAPPIPAHILDIRRDTHHRIKGWALVVIQDRHLHPRLTGSNVPAMCQFLHVHADHLAQHEAANDILDELADSARACTRTAYPTHTEPQYVGPCQQCGADLHRRYGATQVTCRTCGQDVEADDLSARLLNSLIDRLMTPTEMARAVPGILDVPINPTTLAQWKARGRITPHGKDQRGRDLFRVGDVLTLVNQQTRRTA